MTTLATVSGNPLLSGKVLALDGPAFISQQVLAEALLALDARFTTRLTPDQMDRVNTAVALQMNYQVAQGLDPFVVQSESSVQQGESRTYRADAIHPQARAILDGIQIGGETEGSVERQFANIRSIRSVRSNRGTGWHGRRPFGSRDLDGDWNNNGI